MGMMKLRSIFLSVWIVALAVSCSSDPNGNKTEASTTLASAEDAAKESVDPLMLEIRAMEARTRRDSVLDRAAGLTSFLKRAE
jgi:hypothetical protein